MSQLVIIRGAPGSGKSTYGATHFPKHTQVATDDFFMHDGQYLYVPAKIQQAHDWCFQRTRELLLNGDNVVVANTFIKTSDVDKYVTAFQEFATNIKVIRMTTMFENTHGVPPDKVQVMLRSTEPYPGEVVIGKEKANKQGPSTMYDLVLKHSYVKSLLNSQLSETSKKNYVARLKRLADITHRDPAWLVDNCNETFDFLDEADIDEPQTLRAYVNAVLAVYKYNPELKEQHKLEYEKWRDKFKEVDKVTEHKYMTLQASDRQIEVYEPWSVIVKKRESLDKDSVEYLLLSMYTMIEPSRADMNKIKIWNKEPTEQQKVAEPNYLIVKANGMTLVYNEFKSKSKRLQKYENELPPQLQKVIRRSLQLNPREYLIVSPRSGEPYHNAHSFTSYFDRMLNRIFGKKVTINTLRHSYINSLDMNKITPLEKEQMAKNLMHSVSTFEKYRLALPASASSNKQKKICEVKCRPA